MHAILTIGQIRSTNTTASFLQSLAVQSLYDGLLEDHRAPARPRRASYSSCTDGGFFIIYYFLFFDRSIAFHRIHSQSTVWPILRASGNSHYQLLIPLNSVKEAPQHPDFILTQSKQKIQYLYNEGSLRVAVLHMVHTLHQPPDVCKWHRGEMWLNLRPYQQRRSPWVAPFPWSVWFLFSGETAHIVPCEGV